MLELDFVIVSHRSSSDPDQPFVLPPFCPWPEALGMWSPNSPLAVATSAAFLGPPFPPSRWETGSSAPHILVVSEDKHQGSSPVNANVLRLIIFIRKHTKTTKVTPSGDFTVWTKFLPQDSWGFSS